MKSFRSQGADSKSLTAVARLANRVKHSPIHPDEERILETVLKLGTSGVEINVENVSQATGLEPIEAFIYLEHFEAEMAGHPYHENAKRRLAEVAAIKEKARLDAQK
jgi:hypothetical protein